MNAVLIYLGAAVLIGWGIGHLIPTKSIVKGFGSISNDNRRIITMEWAAEGMTLIFIGALILLVTLFAGYENSASVLIYRICSVMLIALTALSFATGAKTQILPMKLCPYVKASVVLLVNVGVLL